MYTVQLGQFVLNLDIVLYLAAGIAGAGAMRLGLKGFPEQRGQAVSAAMNAVIIWIVVWKGSQFIFWPSETIGNLFNLLYFSGGIKGAWLAGGVAVGYILLKLKKLAVGTATIRLELAFLAAMGWMGAYYIAHLLIIDHNFVFHGLSASLGAGLLIYLLRTKNGNRQHSNKLIAAGLYLSLGKAAIAFTDDSRVDMLYSFSASQLIWLAVSLVMLVTHVLQDTARRKGRVR